VLQRAGMPVVLVCPAPNGDKQHPAAASAEESDLEALPVSVVLTPGEVALVVDSLENRLIAAAQAGHATAEIDALLTRLPRAARPFESHLVPPGSAEAGLVR
jgi:hypothetical protein